ncbi:hypothetical protein BH11BAC6_BH11BAC6_17560 [soil metagenome]
MKLNLFEDFNYNNQSGYAMEKDIRIEQRTVWVLSAYY